MSLIEKYGWVIPFFFGTILTISSLYYLDKGEDLIGLLTLAMGGFGFYLAAGDKKRSKL